MTEISSFLCDSGYWCLEGLTVADPVNVIDPTDGVTVIGDICSQGKFCSGNLIHEQDCADGFYSDTTGLAVCTTCPVGFYCDNMIDTAPIECIPNSECDLGSKRQPICPAGMFEEGTTSKKCSTCSQTYYCRAGIKVDQCVAGYICDAGLNTVPNPSIGQCPEGFYCPKGYTTPVRCPFETMSVQTAQRQMSDCRGC